MIEPVAFGFNHETATNNNFQKQGAETLNARTPNGKREMLALRTELQRAGMEVVSFRGRAGCPDDVFPNWMSTLPDKTLCIWPMQHKSRQRERRRDILKHFAAEYETVFDFSAHEKDGTAAEGTSAMLHDHIGRVVYAARSGRLNNDEFAARYASSIGYELELFNTHDPITQKPFYHNDVLGHIGTGFMAFCFDAITQDRRAEIETRVKASGREIIRLTIQQVHSFSGNAFEAVGKKGQNHIVMSDRGLRALGADQIDQYRRHVKSFITASLPTLQNRGGGAAACAVCPLY